MGPLPKKEYCAASKREFSADEGRETAILANRAQQPEQFPSGKRAMNNQQQPPLKSRGCHHQNRSQQNPNGSTPKLATKKITCGRRRRRGASPAAAIRPDAPHRLEAPTAARGGANGALGFGFPRGVWI